MITPAHVLVRPRAPWSVFVWLCALSTLGACGSGGDGNNDAAADTVGVDGGQDGGKTDTSVGQDAGATDTAAGQDSGAEDAGSPDVVVGPLPKVSINEVCAKGAPIGTWNPTGSDWIELYNGEAADVDLSGYRINDSAKQPFADAIALPKGTKISAKGYLIIYFNHNGAGSPNIDKGLSGDEAATLFHVSGKTVDMVNWEVGDSPVGGSWGRDPDGSSVFKTFDKPTPGKPNGG